MFDIYLLTFGKNHRSTSQPNITGLTPTQAKLKAPCTILKPVIELKVAPENQGSWLSANYVYIPDFNRYYYIVNTVFDGSLVILSLAVDYLASWKSQITSSSQYVLRAASQYDGTIRDTRYPVKAVNPDWSGTYGDQKPNPFQPASVYTLGCIVVGIVQKGAPFGTLSYYVMSQLVFLDFMLKLFNLPTFWQDGSDIADGLKKAITDPMQYVVSAMWYPYSVNDFVNRSLASATSSVTVGYDTISLAANAYSFNTAVNIEFTNVVSLNIPEHPQASARGSYMNFEPFSRYYLSFYPFCNLAELDSTQVGGKGTIYCVYTVDLRTGKGVCSVCTAYNGSSNPDGTNTWTPRSPLRVFEAQVGVTIPVATIHTEIPGINEYLTNLAISAADHFGGFDQTAKTMANTGSNWIMGGIAKLFGSQELQDVVDATAASTQTANMGDLSDIATNALAMKSTCESLGSQGTMSIYSRMPIAAWGNFFYAAEDNLNKYGRPLCKYAALNTFSGFVQCDNPYISSSDGMTLQEQFDIERDLAEGIYIQ